MTNHEIPAPVEGGVAHEHANVRDESAAPAATDAHDGDAACAHPHAHGDAAHARNGAAAHAHVHDDPATHTHLHVHADGTVHAHFHHHPDAGWAHAHVHRASNRVILEAKGAAYAYPRADAPVFEEISLAAHAGSMLAILGNNGAGKSTLLNVLGGICAPSAGAVSVGGSDLGGMSRRQIAQHIAYVTQQQRIPHLSVYDEVLLGRKPHVSWSITDHDREVVSAAIAKLGLEPFADRFCDELSGGERQKVYIARALAQETEVLLLDEPTSALDPKNQIEVLSALREITDQTSLATIMVIHDINLALRFCDRFLLVRDGRVVCEGDIESVTAEALAKTYDIPMRLVASGGERIAVASR